MLKIAAAQYLLKAHSSFDAFQNNAAKWVEEAIANNARLLIFPEYGSIELVSLLDLATQKNLLLQLSKIQNFRDDFLNCYQALARKHNVYILAPSFPWKLDEKTFVNRAFLIEPDGNYLFQDKQVMTRFEDEDWKISKPLQKQLQTFTVDDFTVGISICFDVEFPKFAQELALKGVDLLLAPSCTETIAGMNRVHIGARARALENQFYVAVSQTLGEIDFSEAIDKNVGKAAIYSTCDKGFPDDGILAIGEVNTPGWIYSTLDKKLIRNVRLNGNVLNFKKMQELNNE